MISEPLLVSHWSPNFPFGSAGLSGGEGVIRMKYSKTQTNGQRCRAKGVYYSQKDSYEEKYGQCDSNFINGCKCNEEILSLTEKNQTSSTLNYMAFEGGDMKEKRFRKLWYLSIWGSFLVLLLAFPSFAQTQPERSSPLTIKRIEMTDSGSSSRVIIEGSNSFEYTVSKERNPLRIIVDMPKAQLGKRADPIEVWNGTVNLIRSRQIDSGARIEIGLDQSVDYQVIRRISFCILNWEILPPCPNRTEGEGGTGREGNVPPGTGEKDRSADHFTRSFKIDRLGCPECICVCRKVRDAGGIYKDPGIPGKLPKLSTAQTAPAGGGSSQSNECNL